MINLGEAGYGKPYLAKPRKGTDAGEDQITRPERHEHRNERLTGHRTQRGELKQHERRDEGVAQDGADCRDAAERHSELLHLGRLAARDQSADDRAHDDEWCLRTEYAAEDQGGKCDRQRRDRTRGPDVEMEAFEGTAHPRTQALGGKDEDRADEQAEDHPPPRHGVQSDLLGQPLPYEVGRPRHDHEEDGRSERPEDAEENRHTERTKQRPTVEVGRCLAACLAQPRALDLSLSNSSCEMAPELSNCCA